MAQAAERVKKYHETRPAPMIDPDLTDLNKKLNAFNYQKGAWILHMLRGILGDEVFFEGIRRYYGLYAGKTALTQDFKAVMEAVSGRSLETFFRQWFHQPGWPEYKLTWSWDQQARQVEVTIRQTQATGLFDMSLDLEIVSGQERSRQRVRVYDAGQSFRFPAPNPPAEVRLDPADWVLKSFLMK